MGPHVSDSGGVKLGSNRVKRGQTRRRLDSGEARDGGAARKTPTGHGRGRSWAHWRALAGARRVVVAAGPMVAGADDGELQGGGRSSDTHGFDVPVRGRTSWWSGSSPRSNPSTMTRPGAGYGIGGHDGDEARRRRASELMGTTSTVRDRPRGQGKRW